MLAAPGRCCTRGGTHRPQGYQPERIKTATQSKLRTEPGSPVSPLQLSSKFRVAQYRAHGGRCASGSMACRPATEVANRSLGTTRQGHSRRRATSYRVTEACCSANGSYNPIHAHSAFRHAAAVPPSAQRGVASALRSRRNDGLPPWYAAAPVPAPQPPDQRSMRERRRLPSASSVAVVALPALARNVQLSYPKYRCAHRRTVASRHARPPQSLRAARCKRAMQPRRSATRRRQRRLMSLLRAAASGPSWCFNSCPRRTPPQGQGLCPGAGPLSGGQGLALGGLQGVGGLPQSIST